LGIATHFISVDWGTTNFRATLVEYTSLEGMDAIATKDGAKSVYDAYILQGDKNQQQFFQDFLMNLLTGLKGFKPSYPIVVSGMVSSSIGMIELPYADFPLEPLGSNIDYHHIPSTMANDLFIISGAKDENGFMRGEEVHAVGLSKFINEDEAILILSGTHSKHLWYEHGMFRRMKNFMTGELFDVLINHSILSQNINASS